MYNTDLNLYLITVIVMFILVSIITFFISKKFKLIAEKLGIHKSAYKELSYACFFLYFPALIGSFLLAFVPMVNVMFLFELLSHFREEIDEKKVLKLYKDFLDKKLKGEKIRLKDNEFNLIKTFLLDTKSINYELIYNKFSELISPEKRFNNQEIDEKVEELKALILKNNNHDTSIIEEIQKEETNNSIFNKDLELDEKKLKEYIKNIESNKNDILKYLDNRTEGNYKTLLGLVLSKNSNPYYNIIIQNAYILSTIIKEFETNNYILNNNKNEDTKNQIRKSIFEFIEVINLIDDLNYKQDKTFKNIENYNNYLESIKSDINKKIAIFGDAEHLV